MSTNHTKPLADFYGSSSRMPLKIAYHGSAQSENDEITAAALQLALCSV